jgi:predicted nucleic acid-binding Zn ribbon protein
MLEKAVRQIERTEAALAWLTRSWTTIVGKTLAAHTRPVRCQGGYLEVAADGKGWRKQLGSMKREFCARVNQTWGKNLICEIKFVAAKPGPKRVQHEPQIEHTQIFRKRKG